MNRGVEVLSPSSYMAKASWLVDGSKCTTKWTHAENKMFEDALAVYDKDSPDRWHKVAAMIPGKTVGDVIMQYKVLENDVSNIEAGLVPIPGYSSTTSPFRLDCVVNHGSYGWYKQPYSPGGKRGPARPPEQERKKGVPWTEEEHKLFLMGLKKYGKGDWRNISRNFVVTRTPTQVASHAQKYFIRQLSGGKDKRRASIHDITTVTLDAQIPSPDNKRLDSPERSASQPPHHHPCSAALTRTSTSSSQRNQPYGGATATATTAIAFNSTPQGNLLLSPYGVGSYAFKMLGQNIERGGVGVHEHYPGSQNNMAFHSTTLTGYF
ncbi:hypothetical protein Nepgr_009218 [Nepenthes gracilis]|uniref:Uncharacterized protein n=1 Tax=Nepenthes gracilis TaxID=150966 RepID=A0AAD3XJY5_NEPGR|nr:hypothetical protein Nepgr_009218 [Nepenthes gracilis]